MLVKKESPNMGTKTMEIAKAVDEIKRRVKKESPNMGTKTF